MFRTFETELAGRPLIVETGKMCCLSNGHCLVRYGDTAVMVNVTASRTPREGIDFFPLSVDYEEKLYSVGKIPGGYIKREAKPSEKAILTSRCIDRPIRPLFPADLRNDCTVVATVLSVEQDNPPEVAAMIGTSIALSISDIPWNGPIGAVWLGLIDGEYIINPTVEQREKSEMHVTLAGTKEKIVMIEAGANEIEEQVMLDGIKFAHKEIIRICEFVNSIKAEIGKPKFDYVPHEIDKDLWNAVKELEYENIKFALDTDDKNVRDERMGKVEDEIIEKLSDRFPNLSETLGELLYKMQKEIVRAWLVEGKRVDGRQLDEIRPLAAEVDLLARTHGSGLFSRGQTQVMTIATLAPLAEMQRLDGIDTEESKRYMHHYNFPSYSVGETRPSRGPGRREIGHGALAERSLVPVLPSEEEFPYAIRTVSEVLSSNGSTSQGSVCGSTLALMAAGVPIKAPVAGISCGLITTDNGFTTMVDIQGLEDFYGEMDFKVAGTKKGITSIQVDIKNDGLPYEVIWEAFQKTKKAREYIIDEVLLKAIAEPRAELSPYAPKVSTMHIDVEKIREVIGQGGKVIQKIVADTGAKIDIEEDGTIHIFAIDQASGDAARQAIELIVKEPEVGEIYEGVVKTITTFGAFVEILPGKDGLCHISKLDYKRVENVEDVVEVGQKLLVKVMEIDEKTGKIGLSHKDTMPKPEGYTEEKREPRPQNRNSNGGQRRDGNRPPRQNDNYKKPEAPAPVAEAPVAEAPKAEPIPAQEAPKAESKEEKGGLFSKLFNK
ncbi:MAG: polyribonucleotide nucleotidyltransferase [Ruminococcaceae bacterium]|nr:polyribonucleotide nucleotidyltransferase [Oscillospiraceae bacterium]